MSWLDKNDNLAKVVVGLIVVFDLLLIGNGCRGDKENRHEQEKSCSKCDSTSHDSCAKNDSTFVVPIVK
jgi:hypothetical protein